MKNIYLRIGNDGVIAVSSSKISRKRVYELIDEKEQWIEKALRKVAQKPSVVKGKEILYFGEVYALSSFPYSDTLAYVCQACNTDINSYYQNFYKKEALTYLKGRLEYFANIMNLEPKEMRLRRMKRQWGNCRSSGVITFNIHLMQVPKECIDYVVVHELAHMVHMNHSKAFHALVEQYLPQSGAKRTRLQAFSASL